MKLHPLFFEPEILSFLFLSINFFGSIIICFILRTWPLSIFSTCLYILLMFFVNHGLTCGRHYLPIKKIPNKTVIITGATSGIGRVCARRLAQLGAKVIIGIRGQERAEKVAEEISKESHGGTVIGYDLDLSSLENVKNFAERIDSVDVLINNAGSLYETYSVTIDGIEKQFATNCVGHFYLTQLLLPRLRHGRVVNVSSIAHHLVRPADLDYSLRQFKDKYHGSRVYALSKLAQIYHASELTRRYGVKAYSLHPGTIISTNLQRNRPLFRRVAFQILSMIGKTVEQGSMTTLFCALSDDAKPGCYHSDCQVRRSSQLAMDTRRAEQCWNETEKLIKEKIK
ncbi:unnamed protein product [Adineta ricciae]|uniref:Retinol dehydrogenase 12-like protein n=1 Tax=Adineta ricciae TaxID=249248 RepID=A0A815P0T4_ADIRI|nr:unnamed protein product [Adineta ricciae]CAF1442181.1 unnamed protein product [Adineta ricciae]